MDAEFVCVRQTRAADCGAACLATIAQTYQLEYSLESLRLCILTDAQGATLLALVEAAQHCGFEAQGILTDLAALPHVPFPCIAHLTGQATDHFVVVHQCDGERLLVADPAQGLIEYKMEDFAKLWSGVLLVLTLPSNSLTALTAHNGTATV